MITVWCNVIRYMICYRNMDDLMLFNIIFLCKSTRCRFPLRLLSTVILLSVQSLLDGSQKTTKTAGYPFFAWVVFLRGRLNNLLLGLDWKAAEVFLFSYSPQTLKLCLGKIEICIFALGMARIWLVHVTFVEFSCFICFFRPEFKPESSSEKWHNSTY